MQRSASSASGDADREWWWIFDPRQSLRARATLLIGLATLSFTALLTWITGSIYHRALQRQLGTLLETLAFQLSDKLDRTVYERYRTLLLGAGLPAIRDHSFNPVDRRRALAALQDANPDLAWIGVADPRGEITAATGGTLEGTSATTRPWFRGARESAYAGPLREIPELARNAANSSEPETSARFFDLAVPLADAEGNFAGVLAAHVRWAWARDLQLSVVPEGMTRDKIGATVYSGNDVLLDSGSSGWTLPPDPPAVADNRRTRGFMLEHTSLGSRYATGFARSRGFREYRGVGWLTVVRQPLDHAFAPVASLRRAIAAWGLAFSVLCMALAWVLAGRHARRLRSVRVAADRIHEGDILTVLPRPHDNSELARMCGALGELVEDLRAKQSAPSDKLPK